MSRISNDLERLQNEHTRLKSAFLASLTPAQQLHYDQVTAFSATISFLSTGIPAKAHQDKKPAANKTPKKETRRRGKTQKQTLLDLIQDASKTGIKRGGILNKIESDDLGISEKYVDTMLSDFKSKGLVLHDPASHRYFPITDASPVTAGDIDQGRATLSIATP